MRNSVLKICELYFAYQDAPLLFQGLNLEIEKGGQVKCIVGPSGVGKSTLLYLCLETLRPDEGSITITGSVLPVFQDSGAMLLPWFNARTNITWGMNGSEMGEIDRVANLLEIEAVLGSLPRKLSGGQQQRIALARALIRCPDLLLLDEPLANLDSGSARRILPNLRSVLKKQNSSALWVTHNISEAIMVADVMCVLRAGGTIHELPVETPGRDDALAAEVQRLLL